MKLYLPLPEISIHGASCVLPSLVLRLSNQKGTLQLQLICAQVWESSFSSSSPPPPPSPSSLVTPAGSVIYALRGWSNLRGLTLTIWFAVSFISWERSFKREASSEKHMRETYLGMFGDLWITGWASQKWNCGLRRDGMGKKKIQCHQSGKS